MHSNVRASWCAIRASPIGCGAHMRRSNGMAIGHDSNLLCDRIQPKPAAAHVNILAAVLADVGSVGRKGEGLAVTGTAALGGARMGVSLNTEAPDPSVGGFEEAQDGHFPIVKTKVGVVDSRIIGRQST